MLSIVTLIPLLKAGEGTFYRKPSWLCALQKRGKMEKFEITAINRGIRERRRVPVTEEVPLTIEVNGKEIATLLCAP